MNADEIANAGLEIVKNALLDRGVQSLVVDHSDGDPHIRFTVELDARAITFGVEVEPFLPVGRDH